MADEEVHRFREASLKEALAPSLKRINSHLDSGNIAVPFYQHFYDTKLADSHATREYFKRVGYSIEEWDGRIFIGRTSALKAEIEIAQKLLSIINTKSALKIDRVIEAGLGSITLTTVQKEAVKTAINSKISIITGSAGSGKTTILKAYADTMDLLGKKVGYICPTGKGSGRMGEAIGRQTQTCHRYFKLSPECDDDGPKYAKDVDAIVIDESSMLDVFLFVSILRRIKPETSLVLVGDANQIPSVGPGNVFKDIIASGIAKVVRLDRNFRQGENSVLVEYANKILNGERLDRSFVIEKDLAIVDATDINIIPTILKSISHKIPKRYNIKPNDIITLSPIYRGELGIDTLNTYIRKRINPKYKEDSVFCDGDKVMATKNNYKDGYYNGDVGLVMSNPDIEGWFYVRFESNPDDVRFHVSDSNVLNLSYACSVHKYQGSQAPAVIIPLTKEHSTFWNRNLLFTGMTRAQEFNLLVGDRRELERAAYNNPKRYSRLIEKIKEASSE